MLTQLELNALAQLLQRTPMTQLEFLKVQEMLTKLQTDIPVEPEPPEERKRGPAEPEA